jgi:hypothetical protein
MLVADAVFVFFGQHPFIQYFTVPMDLVATFMESGTTNTNQNRLFVGVIGQNIDIPKAM